MYNKARTLLLNTKHEIDGDHIPSTFNPVGLSGAIEAVHNILFPRNTPIELKLFLAKTYLQVIEAAGLSHFITDLDPKITYDLSSEEYFKIFKVSSPKYNDGNNTIITIFGDYNYSKSFSTTDNIIISQIDDSDIIRIYSVTNNVYYTNDGKIVGPTNPSLANITVEFTDPVTLINVGPTGLYFYFSTDEATFTSSEDKTWEFTVEGPHKIDLVNLYNSLARYAKVNSVFNNDTFHNLWLNHDNVVYKLSGLILNFIYKVNEVYGR